MSAHGSSHSDSHGSSIFSTAKNWFATKSPNQSNPLKSIDEVGSNLLKGVVNNTTDWVADVLNPLWVSAKNAGSLLSPSAYREHGWKNIPKSISGVASHVIDSVNNLIAGGTRGLDQAYTNIVTNSLVDVASGTTDRVPVIGKLAGNTVKAVNVIPAAPIRFLARAWEETFDKLTDWMKSFSTVKGGARHLTTASSSKHTSGHH